MPTSGDFELWHETGDRLREGDSLRLFSGAPWRLCRGREAAAAAALARCAPW